jgi:GDPmannose 4,6-dehydratase
MTVGSHSPHRPALLSPHRSETLLGDPTKAKQKLVWVPEITLDELVQEMVVSDWPMPKNMH